MTKNLLLEKAKKTLLGNLRATREGPAFAAGGNQFHSMWVRDFCFAVPGLLLGGFVSEATNALLLIFKYRSPQNLLPRGIDTVPPQLRVLFGTVFRWIPRPFRFWDKSPLKAEFLGEHKTPAFDSNLLFLRALCDVQDFTKEKFLLNLPDTQEVLGWYDSQWSEGFLFQPAYSDWHDSAKRMGSLLHTQLLFIEVIKRLRKVFPQEAFHKDIEAFEKKVFESFFNLEIGLFQERIGPTVSRPQYALDSHMMVLNNPQVFAWMNKPLLYKTLKAHGLWMKNSIPGIPISPAYREGAVSWTTKIVGLRHYHDGFLWGWLIAESVRTAKIQKDFLEAERITEFYFKATEKDPFLAEIYEMSGESMKMVKRPFYTSEAPFTWTAGKWIQALNS